ncbi:prepilin peptidase [Leptothoe sp. ISB3NOV94-8A]|uniref:Prepilin leader peptidase/N-methyltransferase n=1 Tax=Adonisia turfae CCMR0081 TaxID=2292702 RepID=A0A6M0RVT6_9CYAN|nr:A24 family peptidase [Adonisia turfae]EKV02576.1 prepilin signal peptidase PulO-like peptidase [Leptolyngbya sp. PCC 7375]NEZ60354.1 prepilin peptidase [Adonisia turfae CCMR0081]
MLDSLVIYLFVFVLGASIGSFLNVVIYRLPAGISLLSPPSRCPRCFTRLKLYDNVPVVGWLWLRGRCRYCRASIPMRYPLVELVSGLLYIALFLRFGWNLETPIYWGLTTWLVALTLIDIDTLTLPNALTMSGVCLGWLAQVLLATGQTPEQTVASALVASVGASILGLWLFDGISLLGAVAVGKTVMGGGDGKLAAMLGAWLGWQGLLLSMLLASFMGAMSGGLGIALGVLDRRQPIPFGPFLAFGAGISVFFGNALIQAYLGLFFEGHL